MITIENLSQLKDVLDLLKPHCVKRIRIGDIEIEVDTVTAAITNPAQPADITEEQVKISLQDLLKDQQNDEMWSV